MRAALRLAIIGGLWAWVLVQPWLMWPNLQPDVSQRLSLVCCCLIVGLITITMSGQRTGLPPAVSGWVALLVLVMFLHQGPIITDGGYFEFFQETAVFSDGIFLLVAVTWGVWGLLQVPGQLFRWLRWAGLLMVCVNLAFCLVQALGLTWTPTVVHPGKLSGLMGLDRGLGAYGVLWLPILLLWPRKWYWGVLLALLPFALVVIAGKVTTWIGTTVAVWWLWRSRWRWAVLPPGIWVAMRFGGESALNLKLEQRWLTWIHTLQAIGDRPLAGWNFHLWTGAVTLPKYGYVLPSIHSDWLSLAFCAGVPVTLFAVCIVVRMAWTSCGTRMARALQASLVAVAVMSAGQSVVSHARIGGLVILFGVWLWHEHRLKEEENETESLGRGGPASRTGRICVG